MLVEKRYNGYYLHNLYDYLWRYTFLNPRYKYISHKLLKRYVNHRYKNMLRRSNAINS